jgi:hypothetical protein
MQYRTRAPELSATVKSRFALNHFLFPLYLNGLFDNPAYTPSLGLAQGAGLRNFNAITNSAGIVSVMRRKFIPAADVFFV